MPSSLQSPRTLTCKQMPLAILWTHAATRRSTPKRSSQSAEMISRTSPAGLRGVNFDARFRRCVLVPTCYTNIYGTLMRSARLIGPCSTRFLAVRKRNKRHADRVCVRRSAETRGLRTRFCQRIHFALSLCIHGPYVNCRLLLACMLVIVVVSD